MSSGLFKGDFSNPFNRRTRSNDTEDPFWTTQQIRTGIRYFTVLFLIFVIWLTIHRLTDRPETFEEKLIKKEAVYLPIKPPPFRVTDPASPDQVVSNPSEKERTYRTQVYSIGNMRYRAATIYWELADIPEGTTYKQVSPLGAIKELMGNDGYDGVVFMVGGAQEYYARSTFTDLILKLKLKQSPSVRLKES